MPNSFLGEFQWQCSYFRSVYLFLFYIIVIVCCMLATNYRIFALWIISTNTDQAVRRGLSLIVGIERACVRFKRHHSIDHESHSQWFFRRLIILSIKKHFFQLLNGWAWFIKISTFSDIEVKIEPVLWIWGRTRLNVDKLLNSLVLMLCWKYPIYLQLFSHANQRRLNLWRRL